jgi:hypothetical protein
VAKKLVFSRTVPQFFQKVWRGTTFVDSHRSGMIVYEGKTGYGFDAQEVHS